MRTLIVGLDAFDPALFETLYNQGRLPNLGRLADKKGYSRFQVANPPQSEVSWSSIATGLDPGAHGMYDFVHRDPQSYALFPSLLPTGKVLGGTGFVRPHNAKTIFDQAAEQGFPSTSLWWPATFPARPESPVRTLPGLGAPDIQGRMGVGSLHSTDPDLPDKQGKTPVFRLKRSGMGRFTSVLEGPAHSTRQGPKNAELPVELLVKDERSLELHIDRQVIPLTLGQWSPLIEIKFKLGLLVSVHAITRIVVTQLQPQVQFYALPLQIHPLHAIWRYGTPAGFVRDAWKAAGPFLTLGWPQDTTALEDGCIDDEQFLALCESIEAVRLKLLLHLLKNFDEGLLAAVFDTLDRVQHMFRKQRPDVIEQWYVRMDDYVGQALKAAQRPGRPLRTLVVSDHGFNAFDYKVHLNRWLVENGYLAAHSPEPEGDLKQADWLKSRAYAIGLNSLYLNLQGREGQGSLAPADALPLRERLRDELLQWKAPDGRSVVSQVYFKEDVFHGSLTRHSPDLLVGYMPGFRGSAETGLGGWKAAALEPNHDHWASDHCFDAQRVPGSLFYSGSLYGYPQPSFRDIPALAIDSAPDESGGTSTPTLSNDDQARVEERLKSLGYL
ncbi:MAG: alkaline phosphatase family protein [Chloroflexota bacterium]